MLNSPIEYLAGLYENVVRYDESGVPSIFVRFYKMKSSELDASLPAHTHPAFIVNGQEQDSILLGKYKAVSLTGHGEDGGTLYSLPGMPPAHTRTYDAFLTQMRAFGGGVSGMTAADRGFLLLLAQKNGWKPNGNGAYGHCADDAARYRTGESVKAGDLRGWRGWLYECLTAHMTSAALQPDKTPTHWRRIRRIGGLEAYADLRDNGGVTLTLNATGPLDWYLDGTPASLCDIVGNQFETDYGYRVSDGELQILADNDAADPDADLSENSDAWQAILPSADDDGYTLVAPGTAGTLHWTWAGGKITLDTAAPTFDGVRRWTDFKSLGVNAAHLPHIPAIVRELGLFPTAGSETAGSYALIFARGTYYPRRGGDYSSGRGAGSVGDIGLGYEYCAYGKNSVGAYYGARMRALTTNE